MNGWSFGFKSKKQKAVIDDTCKSELVAARTCVEDLVWACKLLKELKLDPAMGQLFMDNQSMLKVGSDVGNFDGVKRYAKKSRKLAEFVEQKKITMHYMPSADNVADMFTKALGPQQFVKLREMLGVEDMVAAIASTAAGESRERSDS